jgi:hypothetical protein
MPVISTEIDKYSVNIFSESESNNNAATVWLFNADGKTIAFFRFYNPGVPMKSNEFRDDLGFPLLSYPISALAPMVDILRNEGPVFFTWFDYRPTRCFGAVGTSREPVGEMES